ncbi:MAG: histidine phosphatase family protein [Gammaproteobacteria bacterium]|nr:histidine phosphatase family protein [Gammaproteobacteria bacterium]MBT8436062.1 histidine phosphatase family protein [Gammaproteobacteria bacterium]
MNSKPRELIGRVLCSSLALLLGIWLLGVNPAAAASPTLLNDSELIDALRSGGYNIYFRHVSTDWSQSDDLRQADDWLSCDPARMRQLSGPGRADAVAIGKAIRKLEMPISEIIASPYCRTVETARLMDLGQVTPSTAVMNLRAAEYFGGRAAIVATAQALLAMSPRPGTNRVIVAHGNVAQASTPVYPAEGEGVVFMPDDKGGFHLVGRIDPADWSRLVSLDKQ